MKLDLSEAIIDAATEVHRQLKGPGLLETVYEAALMHELRLRGLFCQRGGLFLDRLGGLLLFGGAAGHDGPLKRSCLCTAKPTKHKPKTPRHNALVVQRSINQI